MKARIEAVQRLFWQLLAAGLGVFAIGVPLRDDGATMDALRELQAFKAGFDREALEATLLGHASAQGVLPLADVASAASPGKTLTLRAAPGAAPVAPRVQLALQTLEQIHALSGESSVARLAAPEPESLSRGLRWRLQRKELKGELTLVRVQLIDRAAREEDLSLEREVVEARDAFELSSRALKAAQTAHERADALHEARRKWKAPWKSIVRANELRVEAKTALDAAQAAFDQARARSETLATRAERFEGTAPARGEYGAAQAVVRSGDMELTLTLPVQLLTREVAIPGLLGAAFPVLHASGLWDELAPLELSAAIANLQARFSWHNWHVEVAGIALGGMTVLQLAPLPLLLLLRTLRRRSLGVGDSYNPFGVTEAERLPRVGFGVSWLNALVLVGLPLVGSALCAWSLLQIDRFPVVPVLSAAVVIVLGASCQTSLGELSELRDAVRRSHSNPPPAAKQA